MELSLEVILQIVSVILAISTIYFANGLAKAKKIAADIGVLLKESSETMEVISTALEDNSITAEELTKISDQAKETLTVAKTLIEEIKSLAGLFFKK